MGTDLSITITTDKDLVKRITESDEAKQAKIVPIICKNDVTDEEWKQLIEIENYPSFNYNLYCYLRDEYKLHVDFDPIAANRRMKNS
jgi:hypothetical protein